MGVGSMQAAGTDGLSILSRELNQSERKVETKVGGTKLGWKMLSPYREIPIQSFRKAI